MDCAYADEIADEFDLLKFRGQTGFGGKTQTRTAADLNLRAINFVKRRGRAKFNAIAKF